MKSQNINFTGERCVLGQASIQVEREHLDRYKFAGNYAGGKVVLDIACGTGYGSKYLLSYKPKMVYGVDISEEAIAYAKDNFKSKKLIFKVGNATDLKDFNNILFDLVVSFETIEHIKNYNKFLKEINRLLKADGCLLISTPNRKYSSPNSLKPLNPYHVKEFLPMEFKILLTKYFNNVELFGQERQTKYIIFRRFVFSIIPKKIRNLLFPTNVRNLIYTKQKFRGINNTDIENSKFILALCKK